MKILQLVTRRQYRGAEVFAANLSTELLKLEHEIIFAGLFENKDNVLEVSGADNRDLIPDEDNKGIQTRLLRNLIKLIKRERPDIIQCNGSDTLKFMVAVSFFVPETPIIYRNISMISEWISSSFKKTVYRSIFKRVDHVSSVGEEAVNDFVHTLKYPREKTSVIRRGIPLKVIDTTAHSVKLRKELGLKKEDLIVLHVGSFSPEKNHSFLLDVFSEIKLETDNVKLICVGDGKVFREIQDRIKNAGLGDTVFLLGFRKEIPELVGASNCLVLSSFVEGVPGVILEAAAQRVPSVATNVGGVSEVLKDGETGYLINDFDENDFRKKLLHLLHDEGKRKNFGEKAYQLVYQEYNPEKNAKKFEELYKRLLHD